MSNLIEFKGKTLEEINSTLEKEGNKESYQFSEWNEVFELMSNSRRAKLSEVYIHSILSNRFELKRKLTNNEKKS